MYIMFDSAADILYEAETVFCTKYDPVILCNFDDYIRSSVIYCTLSGVMIYFYSAVIVYVLYSKDYPCFRGTGV